MLDNLIFHNFRSVNENNVIHDSSNIKKKLYSHYMTEKKCSIYLFSNQLKKMFSCPQQNTKLKAKPCRLLLSHLVKTYRISSPTVSSSLFFSTVASTTVYSRGVEIVGVKCAFSLSLSLPRYK